MSEQSIPVSSFEIQPLAMETAEAVRWAEEIMAQENSLRLAIVEHEAALMQLRRAAVNLHPDLQKADQILATKNKLNDEIMMVYRGDRQARVISRDIPQLPAYPPRSSEHTEDKEVLGVPPDEFFDSVSAADVAHGGLLSIVNNRGARRR